MAALFLSSMAVLKSSISHGNNIQVHNAMHIEGTQLNSPHLHQPSTATHFYMSMRGRRSLKIVRLAVQSSDSVHKLCEEGKYKLAVEYVREMISKGSMPDKLTLATVLKGLCEEYSFTEATEFVLDICPPDVDAYNCLIDALCRVGQLGFATAAIGLIGEKGVNFDSSSYNQLINQVQEKSLKDKSVGLKKDTLKKGVEPTGDASRTE